MRISEIIDHTRQAKAQTGRSQTAQIIEMVRLRYGRGGITPEYYFNYRLFEPAMSWSAKREYVGPWIKSRIYRIQDVETAALCSDKLRAYSFFDELGLPYPRLLAATHPDIDCPGVTRLHSASGIADWLRGAAYPFFVKPAVSYLGYGNKLVAAREDETLVFGDDTRVAIDTFADMHGSPGQPTLLFQELVRPHPLLEAAIGRRVATARIVVLNDGPEPEIFAAGLRIPSGKSMVDNFQSGRSGNMIAFMDLKTGVLHTVLGGIGLSWREVETHADTGVRLVGFRVPDWDAAVGLVTTASKALPGLKIHGWDVAFSDRGPLLIETNPRGDLNSAQLGRGRGFASPRVLKLYPGGKI